MSGQPLQGDEAPIADCWVRACKGNEKGKCQRYKNVGELKEDFDKGGGCAFTWFFTGRFPEGR